MTQYFESNDRVVGTVAGTGASLNVPVGFVPRKVEVYNETKSTCVVWVKGMTSGKGFLHTGAAYMSVLASAGISEYDGSSSYAPGFTIGADGSVNISADTLVYVAYR